MAVIALSTGVMDSNGPVNVSRTNLSASDTLAYTQGSKQMLFLYNTTASPVVVTLTGSAPTTLNPSGYGGTISTAGGKSITVPASSSTLVDLDDIWAFLTGNGTVTVSGGTGLTAHLYV